MGRHRKTKAEKLREVKLGIVDFHELSIFDKSYLEKLDEKNKYSLKIDPENLYQLDDTRKLFIYNYIQHRNIPLAAKLTGINENQGIALYKEHAIREEIDRITMALYVRNFTQKMLTVEEIGSYLTAIITDQVPEADKLSTKDKVPVLKMLIDINTLKKDGLNNPQIIDAQEFETDVKNMSVKAIKQLIEASQSPEENTDKEELINQINKDDMMTPQELDFLKTLNKQQLFEILNDLTGKDSKQ